MKLDDIARKEFGQFLRETRESQGLTLGETCKLIGFTTHQYLMAVERGRREPSPELLRNLGAIYRLRASLLVNVYSRIAAENIHRLMNSKPKIPHNRRPKSTPKSTPK